MRSYLEILTELKDTIDSDTAIPALSKQVINNLLNRLFGMLWWYSD